KTAAQKILQVLHQDGPGIDMKLLLSELDVNVSGLVVREVLLGILKMITYANKNRCAKLGYKFFVWSSEQQGFKHTLDAYHTMMSVFAECGELKAMWRLLDEMVEKGYPTTARTFHIVICTCGAAGIARKVVERFIKSKNFKYRPYRSSYNAILRSLVIQNSYKLIEWVYRRMLRDGHSPDVLTYNIVMCAKFRLGKLDEFHGVVDEMSRNGLSPDLHTYGLLLHVLGKVDKPAAALKLLEHMEEAGTPPSILHFTTLIDGLSRAGNLEAGEYFFNEMIRRGGVPDVVCYTVMVAGYVVAGEVDKAREIFDEMIRNGQVPNAYTYNSMIRGLCMARKFAEAQSLLTEMESKGCNPNFMAYTTLVGYLRGAGELAQAHDVIRQLVEKGKHSHLVCKITTYRR
ncbi:hypothetical protein M569_16866, partial [Genlisea aurea]